MPAYPKTRTPRVPEVFEYPTGMVWCPMKMSGMAIMKCARLQRDLGCGSRRELQLLKATMPERVRLLWPWLRNRGECRNRATEKQVRELLLAVTPLKLVQRSRKNPQTYRCPGCGGRKVFGARQCRRCWRSSVKGRAHTGGELRIPSP
jgi:hypothetical protein